MQELDAEIRSGHSRHSLIGDDEVKEGMFGACSGRSQKTIPEK